MKQPFITYHDVPIAVDTETGSFSVTIHEREYARFGLDEIKKIIERSFEQPKPVRKDVNLRIRCFDLHNSNKVIEAVYVGVHKKGNAAPEHVFRNAKGQEMRAPTRCVPTTATAEQLAAVEAAHKTMEDAQRAFEDAVRAAGIKDPNIYQTLSPHYGLEDRVKEQTRMAESLSKYTAPES